MANVNGLTVNMLEAGTPRFQAPLTDRLSLQGAMQTSHTNHPYPGSKKNDLLVSLGLTVQIGKQSLGAYDGSSSNVGTLAGFRDHGAGPGTAVAALSSPGVHWRVRAPTAAYKKLAAGRCR